jgi:FkbM family methyltransferase
MSYLPPNGYISEYILKQFPPDYRGFGIDVGASDGVSVNSTLVMERGHRWTILSVEANPDYAPSLRIIRTMVEICACDAEPKESAEFKVYLENPEAFSSLRVSQHPKDKPNPASKWKTIQVPVRTVDQLLAKWQFPKLDVLCVDTEGTELDVLKGCDLNRWKPKVIAVECWNKDNPVSPYLTELGYTLGWTSVENYLWVRKPE